MPGPSAGCYIVLQSNNQQGAVALAPEQTPRNRTEWKSSNTDQCLEGMEFVMNTAFQTRGRWRIDCLTNGSGIIKGKIKLMTNQSIFPPTPSCPV